MSYRGVGDIDPSAGQMRLFGYTGANNLPISLRPMFDVRMLAGTDLGDQSINLEPYMAPKNSNRGALTFGAESSDESIVTTSVEGSFLTLSPVAAGEAVITVSGTDRGATAKFDFNTIVNEYDPDGYNIDVVKLGRAGEEPLASAVDAAALYWGSVLGDIADVEVEVREDGSTLGCGSLGSLPYHVAHIDDVAIIVLARQIDGPGGILAGATPCQTRDNSYGDNSDLAALGFFMVDQADIDYLVNNRGGLQTVLVHEMGHILGIGAGPWNRKFPVDGVSYQSSTRHGTLSVNPWSGGEARQDIVGTPIAFLGINAYNAWIEAGGAATNYPLRGTPVANVGGSGSYASHWQESLLENELMTPIYNGDQFNPFSRITAMAMEDLGYDVNDGFIPDAYTVPAARSAGGASPDMGRTFDLTNDMLRIPIGVIGRNGMQVGVIEPPPLTEAEQELLDKVTQALAVRGKSRDVPRRH